jgi:secretion/DNA translocation related TadE-like protein
VKAERGSVTVIAAAVLMVSAVLSALLVDLAVAGRARGRAQAVADAAALAAAQELVIPRRDPADVAREYAERAGAILVSCRCDPGGRDAVVEVELAVPLPFLGREAVASARARAEVALPDGAAGLQPWFAARLGCLFDRVSGLRIVSGFRTREEQARLWEEKPDLAAPPGHSMHELGLAADLGFADPSAQAHAHREAGACGLGFPVEGEPWHAEPAPLLAMAGWPR